MKTRSLTARLALAFALIAGVSFGGVGIYLYRALATQIIERDNAELLRKATRAGHALAELSPSDQPGSPAWNEILGVVKGNDEYGMRVRAADGALLAANGANYGIRPEHPDLASETGPDMFPVAMWNTPGGTPVRLITLQVRAGVVAAPVTLEIFQLASSRVALLRAYRWKVFAAACLGALGAGILGFAALRAGMAPLRRIAAGTESITFTSGTLPIDPSTLPAELDDLAGALQKMIDRLRERYDRLSHFSADLAHDFRTPIGNLLGQTQVALGSDRSADEYQSLLASNVEEYERLSRMIENMLFLARADNARVALHLAELDLKDELLRQADYFELLAEARAVTIRVDAHGRVFADATLLRRALGNLLANAVRYAHQGSEILVRGRAGASHAAIEITNAGPGIDPAHLPLLFDRFFRADPSRANSVESSGIGLAIVKTIMDLHQGAVSVQSEPEALTSFRLEFPDRHSSPLA
ncbi:heavy metal sensor histidine kinase [Cupriavidus sp. 2KB_3]|uniref:heavy metal sensor histidine kinase n=1 Tax=Cupriavidus TaxID=106589 RepID=UPI0011EE659F|nr:heavy metal sensor histidine kinase [Cupriavidus campinensis]